MRALELASVAHWDWAAISGVAVALGTLALATATFKLAGKTDEVVAATQQEVDAALEQAKTAQATLEAQTQPFLTNVPPGLDRDPYMYTMEGEPTQWRDAATVLVQRWTEEEISFAVPFRNVGSGVAIVQRVAFVLTEGTEFAGYASNAAVPPSERSIASLAVQHGHSSWAEAVEVADQHIGFSVLIGHADAAGQSRGALRLDVVYRGGPLRPWYVRQVHFADTVEEAWDNPRISSMPID